MNSLEQHRYDFHDAEDYIYKSPKGLSKKVVESISSMKQEPDWMLQFRLKALDHFLKRQMPAWGPDLSDLDLDEIYFYVKPMEGQGRKWSEIPDNIKNTFDKLGIPEAEQKFLAGVGAQYESEMVYHSIQEHLEKQGVIFLSIEDGLKTTSGLVQGVFWNSHSSGR